MGKVRKPSNSDVLYTIVRILQILKKRVASETSVDFEPNAEQYISESLSPN
jgi:hypothetical protein